MDLLYHSSFGQTRPWMAQIALSLSWASLLLHCPLVTNHEDSTSFRHPPDFPVQKLHLQQ
uniref:Uncharacterized protein n=1 Tax=Anguilla anguilla TaxID=7936 RepID=A0A0E9WSM6_ANGAN